jgi:hypothetical protein
MWSLWIYIYIQWDCDARFSIGHWLTYFSQNEKLKRSNLTLFYFVSIWEGRDATLEARWKWEGWVSTSTSIGHILYRYHVQISSKGIQTSSNGIQILYICIYIYLYIYIYIYIIFASCLQPFGIMAVPRNMRRLECDESAGIPLGPRRPRPGRGPVWAQCHFPIRYVCIFCGNYCCALHGRAMKSL